MTSRSFAVLALAVFVGVAVRTARSDPASQPTRPNPVRRSPIQVQGVATCSAAGCHNANGRPGSAGSEYSTWVSLDKHAHAYDALLEPRSVAIVRKLGWSAKAHEDARCLACHATTNNHGSTHADILGDGVGCESCHGPAENWRTTHYQTTWNALDWKAKHSEDLFPTKNLADRVARCAECHVGSPTQDVNHDLIAAGHPRLTFEYTAYHHLMPRHWTKENAGAEFEARAWLVGQIATAKAAVELLGARAERAAANKSVWPELAEYSCYACHHTLDAKSWPQQRGRAPGAMPWGDWNLFVPRTLVRLKILEAPPADPLAELTRLMHDTSATPAQVAAAATECHQHLADWSNRVSEQPVPKEKVREVLRALATDTAASDWDQATQHYLAMVALLAGLGDLDPAYRDAKYREPLMVLRKPLVFAGDAKVRFDSPTTFSPEEYRAALEKLRAALEQ